MVSISKEYHFSAAHRIEDHPKCGRLHGHNYKVVVTLFRPGKQPNLDEMGFVMDFGVLNKIMGPVLEIVDHRYIVSETNILSTCPYVDAALSDDDFMDDIVQLPIAQTSAELLTEWFKHEIAMAVLEHGFREVAVAEVQVWETNKAFATS